MSQFAEKSILAKLLATENIHVEHQKTSTAYFNLETRTVVLAELAYVANMALAADRIEPWDLDAYESVVRRLRAGLLLGLSILAQDAAAAREVVATVP